MSSDGVILEEVKQSAWEVELPLEEYWILHSPEFPFERIKYKLELYTDWSTPGWIFQKLYIKGPSVAGPLRIVRWQVGTKRSDGTGVQWIGSGEDTVEEECPGWKLLNEWKLFERSEPGEKDSKTRERLTVFLHLKAGPTGTEASTQTELAGCSLFTLGQNLKDLYLDQKDCDVTIEVRGVSFRAHRAILKARNPGLGPALTHDMVENRNGVIQITDCEPNAFEVFLLFMYTGMVENLTRENVADVYCIADKYRVSELMEICVQHMLSSLSIDSICNTISFAAFYNDRELLEKAIEFFMKNAQEILPSVEWQRFLEENPTQGNELYIRTLNSSTKEK